MLMILRPTGGNGVGGERVRGWSFSGVATGTRCDREASRLPSTAMSSKDRIVSAVAMHNRDSDVGHLQPSCAVPSHGSLSSDSFRARRMLLTAESGQKQSCRPCDAAIAQPRIVGDTAVSHGGPTWQNS